MSNTKSNTNFHRCSFRVYYGDTDAGGVMYHAAYIDFFARARNEWCRDFGLTIERQKELGLCFIIHQVNASYHKPARLDDLVEVVTEVKSLSRVKIIFNQKLYRKNQENSQELLCEAQITAVCVDASSLEVKRLPSVEMASLEKRLKYRELADEEENLIDLLAMPNAEAVDFEPEILRKKLFRPTDFS